MIRERLCLRDGVKHRKLTPERKLTGTSDATALTPVEAALALIGMRARRKQLVQVQTDLPAVTPEHAPVAQAAKTGDVAIVIRPALPGFSFP